MSPSDPIVAIGSTLVMNCTLSPGLQQPLNTTWPRVYFQVGDLVLEEYTQALGDTTAQLTWPVSTFYNRSLLHCCLHGHQPLCVAQETFTVAGR